jgi:hypothetical protein
MRTLALAAQHARTFARSASQCADQFSPFAFLRCPAPIAMMLLCGRSGSASGTAAGRRIHSHAPQRPTTTPAPAYRVVGPSLRTLSAAACICPNCASPHRHARLAARPVRLTANWQHSASWSQSARAHSVSGRECQQRLKVSVWDDLPGISGSVKGLAPAAQPDPLAGSPLDAVRY